MGTKRATPDTDLVLFPTIGTGTCQSAEVHHSSTDMGELLEVIGTQRSILGDENALLKGATGTTMNTGMKQMCQSGQRMDRLSNARGCLFRDGVIYAYSRHC